MRDLDRLSGTHELELRLLEVGGDPDFQRHQCDEVLADLHVVAGRDVPAGDRAGLRGGDLGVGEIEPRLLDLRRRAPEDRFRGVDLAARHGELRLGRLEAALRRDQGRRRPPRRRRGVVERLLGGRQLGNQGLAALELGQRVGRIGFGDAHLGARLVRVGHDHRPLRLGLRERTRRIRLVGLGLVEFCPQRGRVDLDQELAGHHGLVVVDRHQRHASRHLRRDPHHVGVDEGIVGRFVVADVEPPRHADAQRREPGEGDQQRRQDGRRRRRGSRATTGAGWAMRYRRRASAVARQ